MTSGQAHYEVVLTAGAEHDLASIYDYVCEFYGVINANQLLDRLLEVVEGLAQFPERGSHPNELATLGIKEYRQTLLKPYRVIYRVMGTQVVIYLIVDGRRQMQTVLTRRLLGG